MASADCPTSVSHRHTCGKRVLTGLLELEADDTTSEAGVDVESLLASHGVNTNDGVLRLNGLATNRAVVLARVLCLVDGGVDSAEAFKALLELG